MIQIGGVYTTLCQKEGMFSQKHRNRNGRCIAILSKVSGPGVDLTLLKKELIFGKGMRTATFQFSESGGSLNGPDLFTDLSFL